MLLPYQTEHDSNVQSACGACNLARWHGLSSKSPVFLRMKCQEAGFPLPQCCKTRLFCKTGRQLRSAHLHDEADVTLEALGGWLPVEGDLALALHVPAPGTKCIRTSCLKTLAQTLTQGISADLRHACSTAGPEHQEPSRAHPSNGRSALMPSDDTGSVSRLGAVADDG